LKLDNATTMFSIQQLTPDEDKMSVVMKGRLATFINDRRISEVEKSYLAEFQYKGGRISLKTFKETNDTELNTAAAAMPGPAAVRPD
jgi:conjugal transfer pilus assembly protein TraE